MDKSIYDSCLEFLEKYPTTICFRVKAHANVVQKHLNPDEKPIYVFAGQKSSTNFSLFSSCVIVLTNKRVLVGKKRLVPGYFYTSITPDMLNDFEIKRGILFGRVFIDTIKEMVCVSNLDLRALKEIEDYLSKYMVEERAKYMRELRNAK